MTNMYDQDDELNLNPAAEHDEWEQAIKDDKTLIPVNERYRIRQYSDRAAVVYCGLCDLELEPNEATYDLDILLALAKLHELEVHTNEDS